MAKVVKGIEFALLSPQDIKKLAVMKVVTPEVYDSDAYPVKGGVMDPRLGVVDPGIRCKTCGGKFGECPGHFGYIELAKPVINVLYVKHIKLLLTYTCPKCGKLLIEKKEYKDEKEIMKIEPPKVCPHCNEKIEKLKFENPYTFLRGKKELNPEEIREHLEKIPDEDARILGVRGGRPEWMVLTLLLVPPITARPSITLESGERSEDDLTHKLVDIIRINQRLAENLEVGAPKFIIEDLWSLLQYHVATYFNNELSGIPPARHRSGRPLKTLAQRLKTKEGRFRHNLTGKRVNFSARSVVSPDPWMSINEVGVPIEVAKELTIPIKVNSHNIEELRKLVLNGPNKHPGANYIIRPDGSRKRILEENKEDIANELKEGYIVERHLMDGDVVLFNRQPSLHRMSVMAHKVRVMPYKTFRLHLCACPPYNADFDGDEMNLHVPQTAEARAEAEELMLVEKNIRSPRFGGPIIGATQDFISGAYILTKDGSEFTRDEAAEILAAAGIYPDLTKEKYTGKELFSMLLPKGLNVVYRASFCEKCSECKKEKCEKGAYVVVKDGELVCGAVDSKGLSPFKGQILDKIDMEYGHEKAREFLDRVTRMCIKVLMLRGFTISISDIDLPEEIKKEIKKVVEKAYKEVEKIIEDYKKGKITPYPGRTVEETREDMIMAALWNVLNEVQDIIKKHFKETDAMIMAKTGARGSLQNLTYMAGIVGQEMIRGGRAFRGYKYRTLSHFKKGDLGPKARGFVESSFIEGLDPLEFFFEVMKGREGIMDSSLKTRVSGYLERRLVNALHDLKIDKDWMVKDSCGTVIQFIPGEDGIDPAKSSWGELGDV